MIIDYEVIGKRIKTERLKKNLKQKDIADKIGISVCFYSRVERGKAKVNLTRLAEISEILEKPISYFLDNSIRTSKVCLDEEFSNLISQCTPEHKKIIYNIVKQYIEYIVL